MWVKSIYTAVVKFPPNIANQTKRYYGNANMNLLANPPSNIMPVPLHTFLLGVPEKVFETPIPFKCSCVQSLNCFLKFS